MFGDGLQQRLRVLVGESLVLHRQVGVVCLQDGFDDFLQKSQGLRIEAHRVQHRLDIRVVLGLTHSLRRLVQILEHHGLN